MKMERHYSRHNTPFSMVIDEAGFPNKKKWAAYIRVSTHKQETLNQKLELQNYIDGLGWDVEWFEEIESTRKTRPVKNNLMMDLRKRKYTGLIIWRLDRWSRSFSELIRDVEELTNNKVVFISLLDLGQVDYYSAAGKLMLQILGAFSQFERELIRERTIEGLRRARAQGKTLGRPRKK